MTEPTYYYPTVVTAGETPHWQYLDVLDGTDQKIPVSYVDTVKGVADLQTESAEPRRIEGNFKLRLHDDAPEHVKEWFKIPH